MAVADDIVWAKDGEDKNRVLVLHGEDEASGIGRRASGHRWGT